MFVGMDWSIVLNVSYLFRSISLSIDVDSLSVYPCI